NCNYSVPEELVNRFRAAFGEVRERGAGRIRRVRISLLRRSRCEGFPPERNERISRTHVQVRRQKNYCRWVPVVPRWLANAGSGAAIVRSLGGTMRIM
ncbi:hypothetical protein, partial [Burkholderia pyrrocinia]|uniref:hypothetical protein n=1 Tax=Burkholderia pyrrocinia TaxID=60550 RepID=UPI002AB16D2E